MFRTLVIWDQKAYNPINGDMLCHIHFSFPDGSKIKKAFTYDWRLWTLPEIRELLLEAGFQRATVYWEGTNEETPVWFTSSLKSRLVSGSPACAARIQTWREYESTSVVSGAAVTSRSG